MPVTPQLRNMRGSVLARVALIQLRTLCMMKPKVVWSASSLSDTNARNGSILMLILASSSHNKVAANQSAGDSGIRHSAVHARMAPMKKYGFRRPSLFHVRSLIQFRFHQLFQWGRGGKGCRGRAQEMPGRYFRIYSRLD